MGIRKPVYLDHHATTPMDPQVLEVLQRVQRDFFGNASSSAHSFGWAAKALVDEARQQVAQLIHGQAREIVFTSGATEANNIALLGTCSEAAGSCRKIITTNLEHSSVAEPLNHLEKHGWSVQRVAAGVSGIVRPEDVIDLLDSNTRLVSIISAQNEIGTVQPVKEIGQECRSRGIRMHCDAAQAAGHLDLDVNDLGIDLLSLSAHKIYGPKGVGALWIRRCHPPLELSPVFFGGSQENSLRPGTLNVPGIAAFGEACRLAVQNRENEVARISRLKMRFLDKLAELLPGFYLNGAAEPRLPGNINIRIEGVKPGQLLPKLTVLALSAGSACRSDDPGPSPVLLSLGLDAAMAGSSLRIGLGRFTTEEEVDFAVEKISEVVLKIRTNNFR